MDSNDSKHYGGLLVQL